MTNSDINPNYEYFFVLKPLDILVKFTRGIFTQILI